MVGSHLTVKPAPARGVRRAACLADLEKILQQHERWLIARDYCGYDPHDALSSPLLAAFTGRSRLLGMAALQLVKRTPVNLRPLLGIRPAHNAKGMGLFLSAYVRLYRATGRPQYRERAAGFAHWLQKNVIGGYAGAAWGYEFPWANRHFYAPRFTPNVVTTVFAAQALLEFHELTGEHCWLQLARSACDFIAGSLNRIADGRSFAFSYTPRDHFCIHNANMLAAALLAQVGALTGETAYADLAERSMRYSLARQQADGSWLYGEEWYNRWSDSFHTGYSLLALQQFLAARKDPLGREALQRGCAFYRRQFFTADGRVRYYPNKDYPLDSHAFAHALIALQDLGDEIPDAAELLQKVVPQALALFWSPEGFFYYRRHRFLVDKRPFLRWVQAWMFLALARLC
ncbi:MAG: hypothetical protein ONB48_15895 [candidate division KSB1 bacterium]|nr:hypothetical protein [candidate division KSB1 bacterium]MDZ7276090.1 hypothetical protein [candidate division KSB1 bacterium]MDZ7287130.1 hypothetical protein [candidate division KSB1 bacterium]MDZ7296945.1 hypothetical protein [candidate division KSB1 bacterium]MDZ7307164.1 hypothetical protein [candidate division KSB1 bacterium]